MLRKTVQVAAIAILVLLVLGILTAVYFDVYVSRLLVTDLFVKVAGTLFLGFLIVMYAVIMAGGSGSSENQPQGPGGEAGPAPGSVSHGQWLPSMKN